MLNIVIFGPPGSGKGTQSKMIAEKYNLLHLSTGDVLRNEIENNTEFGIIVKSYINSGELVPDDLILKHLYYKATEYEDTKGIIFDGFPRTTNQAEILDKMLEKRSDPIKLVIRIEVDEDEIIRRMIGRGEDSNRGDDKENIIHKRIKVYKEQTYPLIDYYKEQGKLVCVDGMYAADKVFKAICRILETCSDNIGEEEIS